MHFRPIYFCLTELCHGIQGSKMLCSQPRLPAIGTDVMNVQRLAGQCGKLKCCLNYELDCYLDAKKEFPDTSINLETKHGTAFHQKTDIFKKILWYSFRPDSSENLTPISVKRVKEILEINRQGDKVENLADAEAVVNQGFSFENDVGQDSLDRFDDKNKNQNANQKKSRRNKKKKKGNDKKR